MIILLKKDAKLQDVSTLTDALDALDFAFETINSFNATTLHITSDTRHFDALKLYAYDAVEKVIRTQEPYIKTQKVNKDKTTITVNNTVFGGTRPVIIAGPCSVESKEQIFEAAKIVKDSGGTILRGGAYKPRTSPYSFQGLKEEGLKLLHSAALKYNLATVSEIVSIDTLPLFEQYVDIIQVGARNMQNFELLKALGKSSKPILLKKGFGNTTEEWLMSAEYLIEHGNKNVILCERGIRTFEPFTRATLDLSSVLAIKQLSHLPVIVDPSHAAGRWDLVEGLSKASIAVGADGLMIEMHPYPERALSDGAQSLKPDNYNALIKQLNKLIDAL